MKLPNRLFLLGVAAVAAGWAAMADELVILHTNDTHSQLDPASNGLGGVARRKVVIDSVRQANDNVILIDAGDAVQGTTYFNIYRGEPEHKVMNALGYDIAIVGNHEFDNGVDELAENIKNDSAVWITTNYDLRESPLDSLFERYLIKEVDGRRIGFIAINLDPKGMIAEGNYDGVKYLDAFKAANSTAWHLKHNERVDAVIAVTHIGFDGAPGPRDIDLAKQSEDIDIIIGGHSHTRLDKPAVVKNAVGRDVLITQTGSRGATIGEVTIDLDDMTANSKLIAVDSRLDDRVDPDMTELLKPYRQAVDSIMGIKIAKSATALEGDRLENLVADYVREIGDRLADDVDLAIVNKGGIRRSLPKGDITQGMVIMMLPFDNRVVVVDIKGSDLRDALDVMASRGGDAVSSAVDARFDPTTGKCVDITIDGKPLDPDKTYRLATIDYLANGGDYMAPMTKATAVGRSDKILYDDVIALMKARRGKIKADDAKRMHQ